MPRHRVRQNNVNLATKTKYSNNKEGGRYLNGIRTGGL